MCIGYWLGRLAEHSVARRVLRVMGLSGYRQKEEYVLTPTCKESV